MPPRSAAEVALAAEGPLVLLDELFEGGEQAAVTSIAPTATPAPIQRNDVFTLRASSRPHPLK
jgi:hypothetical protein